MANNKKRRTDKRKQQRKDKKKLPLVSICTPTFNRRPFFEATIKCYLHQDYPRELLEWIIIDDGTDPIEDVVKDVPGVKYFRYEEKMTLGKKRNLMHEKCSGDIIVYMDDDDYYPPQRVSHAVHMLKTNPKAMCAGSSEVYLWFKHIGKMYQFGPYGPNHATAGTFAFRKELLEETSYEDNAALAEEKHFLKNYTVPFVQLEPLKSILVFSHEHNTFDKRKLLNNPNPKFCKESPRTVDEFIKEADLKKFFIEEIEGKLKDYEPGLPKHKPDVLKQTAEIEERRKKMAEDMAKQNGKIMVTQKDGKTVELNNGQLLDLLKSQQAKITEQQQQLVKNNDIFKKMKQELDNRQTMINKMNEIITNLDNKVKDLQKQLNTLGMEKTVIVEEIQTTPGDDTEIKETVKTLVSETVKNVSQPVSEEMSSKSNDNPIKEEDINITIDISDNN